MLVSEARLRQIIKEEIRKSDRSVIFEIETRKSSHRHNESRRHDFTPDDMDDFFKPPASDPDPLLKIRAELLKLGLKPSNALSYLVDSGVPQNLAMVLAQLL